jgi:hypothetical protein
VVHLITYDLHAPGRDYPDVKAAIDDNADDWAHPQGSVWLVDTLLSPKRWYEILRAAGDSNDEHLIVRLTGSWWSANLDADAAAWIHSPSRRW